jgi:hypothetical protein
MVSYEGSMKKPKQLPRRRLPRTDPYSRLASTSSRQMSDVAQKLVAMCLHELSSALTKDFPELRVTSTEYAETHRRFFGDSCAFCSEPLVARDTHAEHLDAMNRLRAGLHVAGNVVLACSRCNMAKRQDDHGRRARQDVSGWLGFLSHAGQCSSCKSCDLWSSRLPAQSERSRFLDSRAEVLRSFRALYPVDALATVAHALVDGLEREYRWLQSQAGERASEWVANHIHIVRPACHSHLMGLRGGNRDEQ